MINYPEKAVYTYDDLVDILHILRAPGGCPWDREQTHESNRRNFLEEAYEAAEAFDLDDPELMKEELGDVLMQVLFNIHMEEEAGRFTTDDVTDHVVRKLIFRHPHVFSNTRADDSEQVLVNWDKLKRQEKGQRTTADAMDSVARSLPALWRTSCRARPRRRALNSPMSPARSTSSTRRHRSCAPPLKTAQTLKKSSATCCLLPSRSAASAASTPRRRFQRPAKNSSRASARWKRR